MFERDLCSVLTVQRRSSFISGGGRSCEPVGGWKLVHWREMGRADYLRRNRVGVYD